MTTCSMSPMVPVRMSGGIARALRMLPGIMAAPVAVAVIRRKSRRLFFNVIEFGPFFQGTLSVIGGHHGVLVSTTVAEYGKFVPRYFIIFQRQDKHLHRQWDGAIP